MKYTLTIIIIIIYSTWSINIQAQESKIIGFWEVEIVEVGEDNMTPIAKWFKINSDKTYQAGNGWLQNGRGKWTYDIEKNLYSAMDSLDIIDEFGGFAVSFREGKMVWEREEEGMLVKVTLRPIENMPMSPADYLEGIWEVSDSNADKQHKIFFRWDRIYLHFDSKNSKKTGYWHIHGHKPEITLLPHQEDGVAESWRIEADEKYLLMTGISTSNSGIERKYIRKNSF